MMMTAICCRSPWYFVREGHGVINFVGGDRPTPLKKSEIDRILNQVEESEGKEKPKIEYEIGEMVKVNEGPVYEPRWQD